MLHYYRVLFTTYSNGVKVGTINAFTIADENEVKEKTIPITWKNLEEVSHDYGLNLSFTYRELRRGRVIKFSNNAFCDKKHRKIYEWKTPVLDMKLIITYKVEFCSLNTILNYWDSNKTIQYLRERNLSCPIDILKKS